MRKRFLVASAIPLVATLSAWLALGAGASAHAGTAAAVSKVTTRVSHAASTSATDADNVRSGDQTVADTSAGESETSAENGGSADVETDGVDCQQDGQFDGVNGAGSGPGCDGSGT